LAKAEETILELEPHRPRTDEKVHEERFASPEALSEEK
jgi:hypothetical protein